MSPRALLFLVVALATGPAFGQTWERNAGVRSGIRYRMTAAVTTAEEWARLWERHTRAVKCEGLPPVDFSREMVVAVFLGERLSGLWRVELTLVPDPADSTRLQVIYREVPPAGGLSTHIVTQPFEIRRVARRYAAVSFAPDQEVRAWGSDSAATPTQAAGSRLRTRLSSLETLAASKDPRRDWDH